MPHESEPLRLDSDRMVDSTVNWRIVDVEVAATMAAETMKESGRGAVAADITKLRRDVLKQALASLASFIGSVNYSNSFHMSAAAAGRGGSNVVEGTLVGDDAAAGTYVDNPLYDLSKMGTAVEPGLGRIMAFETEVPNMTCS